MVDDAQIVKETRRVRCSISEKFDNDPDRYIDYLLSQEDKNKAKFRPSVEPTKSDQSTETTGQC